MVDYVINNQYLQYSGFFCVGGLSNKWLLLAVVYTCSRISIKEMFEFKLKPQFESKSIEIEGFKFT